MLEKKKKLRKIEFTFTDEEVNSVCHCLYEIQILEDGQEISKSNHRENKSCIEMQAFIAGCEIYEHPKQDI